MRSLYPCNVARSDSAIIMSATIVRVVDTINEDNAGELLGKLCAGLSELTMSGEPWSHLVEFVLGLHCRVSNLHCKNLFEEDLFLRDFGLAVLKHCDDRDSLLWFTKLAVRRKVKPLVWAFLESRQRLQLLGLIKPNSILLFGMFNLLGADEFLVLLPSLSEEQSAYLTSQLPFKAIYSREKADYLVKLYTHYELVNLAVDSLSVIWGDKDFLENSDEKNHSMSYIVITLILYYCLNPQITADVTKKIFKGIQFRLSYNNQKIKNSAFVNATQLIASLIEDLLHAGSEKHFFYTIDDYLRDVKYNDVDDEGEVEAETRKINYLEDLVDSLKSENIERVLSGLEGAPSLIEADLADLDIYIEQLSETFVKMSNRYNLKDFGQIRKSCLVSLGKTRPSKTIECLHTFLNDSEGSLGTYMLILDVFMRLSEVLANPIVTITPLTVEQTKDPHLSVIRRRLKEKTRYFHRHNYRPISTTNLFLPHFEPMCSGIIQKLKTIPHSIVVVKCFHTLSGLLVSTGDSRSPGIAYQCSHLLRPLKYYSRTGNKEVVSSCLVVVKHLPLKLQDSESLQELVELLEMLGISPDFESLFI